MADLSESHGVIKLELAEAEAEAEHEHEHMEKMCRGITQKGCACKYKASNKEQYCKIHVKKYVNLSECSICMELCNMKYSIETKCKHIFHKKWESSKCGGFKTCPNCRSNIFEDKIFLKLKASKLDYLLCLRWIFITITSINHLTPHEMRIQKSNEKKYSKMIQKSPGLRERYNIWGSEGNKSDDEFFSEKHKNRCRSHGSFWYNARMRTNFTGRSR